MWWWVAPDSGLRATSQIEQLDVSLRQLMQVLQVTVARDPKALLVEEELVLGTDELCVAVHRQPDLLVVARESENPGRDVEDSPVQLANTIDVPLHEVA